MEYVLPSTKWIWAPGKESLQFAEPRLAGGPDERTENPDFRRHAV